MVSSKESCFNSGVKRCGIGVPRLVSKSFDYAPSTLVHAGLLWAELLRPKHVEVIGEPVLG